MEPCDCRLNSRLLFFQAKNLGLANVDMKSCGKIGVLTAIYFLTTTVMATVLGVILVVWIHSGSPKQSE